MKKLIRAAFLDVDRVLIKIIALVEFARYLTEKNCFATSSMEQIENNIKSYCIGELDYRQTVIGNTTSFAKGLKGQDAEKIKRLAWYFFDLKKELWYFDYSKQLVSILQKYGFRVILITASPIEIIECLGQDLGVFSIFALTCEITRKEYVDKILLNPGLEFVKRDCLAEYCLIHDIDSKKSFAIADGVGDAEMLSCVKYPIALNPCLKMKELAKKRNWLILEEGKDNVLAEIEKIIFKILRE